METLVDPSEDYGMSEANDSAPVSLRFSTAAPAASGSTLDVAKAQKIIKAFTDDPSWLADPRTSHAANSVFAAASKVVGMNMQLERVNALSEASKARNSISSRVGQSLLKLAETGEVGAGIAAKWYALGDDGKPLYENPANASAIFEDYKSHVAGTAKQFSHGPIATAYENARAAEEAGNFDEAQIHRDYAAKLAGHSLKTDEQIAEKAKASKIATLTTDLRSLETKYDSANAEYKKQLKLHPGTAEEPESQEASAFRAKAEYFLRQKNAKQKQIDALTAPTPATNAPATSAPAPTAKRVRVVGPNGEKGTVIQGETLPQGWSLE